MRQRAEREDTLERRELLDAAGVRRTLERLAREIRERNADLARLLLVGIRTGGVVLAERLCGLLGAAPRVPVGVVDITLYRDDIFVGLPRPEVGPTELPCALDGRVVVLVDDVLYTGRTIRAALDALMDYGRPRQVQLAVLVDRGHRELPIQAGYVGLTVETTREQSVRARFTELGDRADRVVLCERKSQ